MKPFELAPLPYAYDYLEPVIDAETMKLHMISITKRMLII